MTVEVQALAEVAPVTEQVETASLAPVVETPDEKPAKAPRVFSQEELDAEVGKRLARQQRKWERENSAMHAERLTLRGPVEIPPADQFESPEAYADALALKKAQELVAKRETDREKAQLVEAYHDREEDARTKYDDFEQVAYNPNIRITSSMAETIQASEIGPDVAYFLGSNPKEADRISKLTPLMQAREIGKIEARLASAPPVKKVTTAPEPITPVAARSIGNPTYDTTDPRSLKSMSTSEWIEAERARQIVKLRSQR